jgi:hypothetical protein
MTVLAVQLKKDIAHAIIDSMAYCADGNAGTAHSKVYTYPHLGCITLTSGQSLIHPNLALHIRQRKFTCFDDLLYEDSEVAEEAYWQTIEQMIEIDDFEGDAEEYIAHKNKLYPGESIVDCEIVYVGYSDSLKSMVASLCASYANFDRYLIEPEHIFGRSNKAIQYFVKYNLNGKVKNTNDLKAVLGYQCIYGSMQGYGSGEIGGGDCILATVSKDRTVKTQIVGNLSSCISIAKTHKPKSKGKRK